VLHYAPGDTFQSFSALQFEIEMTPTSSNVLFGLWSHDIGGNHNGTNNPGRGSRGTPIASPMLRIVERGVALGCPLCVVLSIVCGANI
jgi:hypothetical protein